VTALSSHRASSVGGDRARAAARIGLLLVAAAQAEVALWGLIAPRSFFSDFPGAGRHWVLALGPYNEHLLRDYAAAELGLAVLLLGAAVWFERRFVMLAGIAFLAGTTPHFAYHLTTIGSFATLDNVGSLGAFVLELALVAAAIVTVTRERSTNATT
jgi:hypothetical protein